MSVIRVAPPQLRTKEEEGRRSATWLELFYDLAFVVAVAVLAGRLLDDVSVAGIGLYFAYFALLWWLWASHTYYADRYDTDDLVYRLLAAGQMVAVVVIAAALSSDQASSTLAFAVGFAVSRVLLVVMYWRAYRHVVETRKLVRGYLVGFGLAALVWIASAVFPGGIRVALWCVALAIDLATPWVMRVEQARVPFDVSHLPERFGLFTILVLGESIAAVVMGLGHSEWAVPSTLTAALGVGIATALWWLYFDNARGAVVRRDASVKRTWRPTVWIYSHLPLAAALVAFGVAIEIAVDQAGRGPMDFRDRWLLVGSIACVLAVLALIQLAATMPGSEGRQIVVSRLFGVPFLLIIGLLSDLEAQWVAGGVLAVCVAELIADMTSSAVSSEGESPELVSSNQTNIEIRDDQEEAYVITVDGRTAGKAVYRIRDGRHVFVHTEIDDVYSGRRLGTMLVRFALDDVRARGGDVVPLCPFFASFIARHPEYEDLVDREMTDRMEKAAARRRD